MPGICWVLGEGCGYGRNRFIPTSWTAHRKRYVGSMGPQHCNSKPDVGSKRRLVMEVTFKPRLMGASGKGAVKAPCRDGRSSGEAYGPLSPTPLITMWNSPRTQWLHGASQPETIQANIPYNWIDLVCGNHFISTMIVVKSWKSNC